MWHYSDPRLKQVSNKNHSDSLPVIEQGVKTLELFIQENGTQEQIIQFKILMDRAATKTG